MTLFSDGMVSSGNTTGFDPRFVGGAEDYLALCRLCYKKRDDRSKALLPKENPPI